MGIGRLTVRRNIGERLLIGPDVVVTVMSVNIFREEIAPPDLTKPRHNLRGKA
jgi:sRNA-binding carbon storage regulator CsrA